MLKKLRIQDVVDALDRLAPFRLAYDWDNVGLQIGDPAAAVEAIAVGLEVDENMVGFAQRHKCQLIIVHHPLLFHPVRRLVEDSPLSRLVCRLIRARIAVLVAHTNLDRVAWGTNAVVAEMLGLIETRPLEPCPLEEPFKFCVFVPPSHTGRIIDAIHRGGGGWIGNYSHCTFRSPGIGTYIPEAGANPYQGQIGRLEEAEEVRLEAIVPKRALPRVLREVLAAHPYEEVAYDVYPLVDIAPQAGLGLVGVLERPTTLARLARSLAKSCAATMPTYGGDPKKIVHRVAIVTGSAGSSVDHITLDVADAVITGELSYHKAAELTQRGVGLICLGHAASEKIVAPKLAKTLATELGEKAKAVRWHISTEFRDPCQPI